MGTVRRPPRGVPKEDFAKRDFYDVWLPELAPSAELVSWIRGPEALGSLRQAMRANVLPIASPRSELVALSRGQPSVGCYCEDESQLPQLAASRALVEAGRVAE